MGNAKVASRQEDYGSFPVKEGILQLTRGDRVDDLRDKETCKLKGDKTGGGPGDSSNWGA